jgi:hypothetical protein
MNTSKTLDKEIRDYLPRLSSRQKQTILTVVKTFAEEDEEEILNDELFLAELDKRFSEMEHGKIKTFSLEEVEEEARLFSKKKKK